MVLIIINELRSVWKSMTIMARTALYVPSPHPSDPPRIRIGLINGNIPVAPLIMMSLLVLGGFIIPRFIVTDGAAQQHTTMSLLPSYYNLPVLRVGAALLIAQKGSQYKRDCAMALRKVETTPAFQPVSAVADTGPYSKCRNPMYLALLELPASIGLICNNAWVAIGSNIVLWLYLHFLVVPVEERFLQQQLGEPYAKYCALVKRWGLF